MKKNPHAVALGKKGGKARLTKMSQEERIRRAREAGIASGIARRKISENKSLTS